MNFLIADTFTAAFNRLSGQDEKAVKTSVFDLQMGRAATGSGSTASTAARTRIPGWRGSIATCG
jgi:hypothetical protein